MLDDFEGLGCAGIIICFILVLGLFVGMFAMMFGNFCMDFAAGSHRITPTAIDQDYWGNYKVYYKTSEYTKNSEEDYYYIDKDNKEIYEQMMNYIKENKTVIVYYDKYVGFKGMSHPGTSPITRIEPIE